MNIKEFNKNMKNSKTIKIDLISQTNTNWEANVKGEFKNQIDENENEKGFNNKQLSQLASLINELVPPIVETIVDQKLEPLRNDVNELKKNVSNILECPTIKKELNL